MAEKFLTIPTADLDVDNLPTTLANTVLHDTTSLTGLTNGTSYRAFVLQNPSDTFSPAAAAPDNVFLFDAGSGGLPAEWTEQWATTNVTYSQVAGGYLQVTRTTTERTAIVLSGVSFSDGQMMAKIRLPQVDSLLTGVFGRISGSTGSETGAGGRFQSAGGSEFITYGSYDAGTLVDFESSNPIGGDPFRWVINTWYIMRTELQGNNLRVRVWPDGDTEPSTWNFEVTIGTLPAGAPGLFFFVPGTVDVEWFSYSDGGVAPFPV